MAKRLTLVDAGTGNLRSVLKAFESLGASVELTCQPDAVSRADKLVLPGVGSFGNFMKGLRNLGLDDPLIEKANSGTLVLGICVGMQALFGVGLEMGEHKGLGLLEGQVERFPDSVDIKVPHTGWNQLWPASPSPLLKNINPGDYAYFNHSYYCSPTRPDPVILYTDYGFNFASAVQHENLFGVQFHPEKSQRIGRQILANFLLS